MINDNQTLISFNDACKIMGLNIIDLEKKEEKVFHPKNIDEINIKFSS